MTASATRGFYETEGTSVTASEKKLSRTALTAMVVGSMVGAGIFSLPATFGNATGPFGALVAWTIAGLGMFTLARVFQALAVRKPALDAGIFAYAREGFGNYAGFIAAFGFWASSCLGNVTYWVLIKSTLGKVWPAFGEGDTVQAVVVSSILLWAFHALILRGVKEAAGINTIVTIAKIIPIVLFIVILIGAFRAGLFASNFWGGETVSFSGVIGQIRSTMLATVFVFIGIEGASVYSRYAKERKDVGWATVMGFIGVLGLMVLVTILPYAVMTRSELGELRQPSMAGVLQHVVGTWGAVFVSVGLMVSVLGAYLAWTLLAAEALHASSKAGLTPKAFSHENHREVPSTALWVTNLLVQAFLILTLFAESAFDMVLEMTSSMTLVPYFLVAAYALKLALTGDTYEADPRAVRKRALIVACVAVVYTGFMLYAGGLAYVLLACILFAPGTILYAIARRERRSRWFNRGEVLVAAAIVLGAVAGIVGLVSGRITL